MLILCWALVMLQTASPILSWLKRVSLGWLESGSGFRSTLGQGPLEHILVLAVMSAELGVEVER